MNFFMFCLNKFGDFFDYLSKKSEGGNCSWCGKYVGRINLKRIWYTETADDVCEYCLNPTKYDSRKES